MGRRLCIYGFCRSIEMLSDVVEDTVLEHGGEVNLLSLSYPHSYPGKKCYHFPRGFNKLLVPVAI